MTVCGLGVRTTVKYDTKNAGGSHNARARVAAAVAPPYLAAPIRMTSSSPEGPGPLKGPSPTLVGVLALALLAARIAGARYYTFLQQDDISLATGVATLMRDSSVEMYRYGPQAGYYRLVQLLSFGDLRAIPWVMITLSAVAATVIPVCGFYLFPDRLTTGERWALAGILAINPLIWMSGTYGNSAMPSVALLVVAFTVLSRRPGPWAEAAALGLYAAAIVVRADAVLAGPALLLLLYRRHGDLRAVLLRAGALGAGLAAVYAVLFVADPRMRDAFSSVASHLTNEAFTTRFWDYLLWSTSPLPLAAAALGIGLMLERERSLLLVLAAWCLPFFAFYYASTTSPRYFLPSAVPVAIASAIGFVALPRLVAAGRRTLTGIVTAAAASLHLFIGMGHFTPGPLTNMLTQAEFETQLGPMWTGALAYKTYLLPHGSVVASRGRAFGRVFGTMRTMDDALEAVAAGADSGHTVAVLTGGWSGHAFYYYALVHGAEFSPPRRPGSGFAGEMWSELGGARLMSVRRSDPGYEAMRTLPVAAGDQVWVMAYDSTADRSMRGRLAPGLVAAAVGDTTAPVRRFTLSGVSQ